MDDEKLLNGKLGRLMLVMSAPTIVAQIINILYSIVDRIYIGHIESVGSDALTGIGVALPIITLIAAFAQLSGGGGAPLAAIWMGKGDRERAERILGNSTLIIIVFSVLLMAGLYAFASPLLYLFGASDDTIQYAMTYLCWYLAGTPFVLIALGLNSFIISQGNTKTAMLSVIIGAVLNIVLDPVFIFVLKLNVAGAAIATVISQAASAAWVLLYLMGKKAKLKLSLKYLKPQFKIIKEILSLGISPFIMRSTESLISIVMNVGLLKYGGDAYVGSLTIMQSVMAFMTAPVSGFTQGVSPIISFNYGHGNFDRVKQSYRRVIAICLGFSFISTLAVIIFPGFWASLFTPDAEIIDIVTKNMPLFMCGMTIFGLQMAIQSSFLALGQAKISLFIAMLRKVILLVPLAIFLPKLFELGVTGVFLAEPVSDIASATTATVLFCLMIKNILTQESLEKLK